METTYTRLVGCRVPIQQAPMGGVSTPDLVVAVAAAGGVGSMTALGISAERLAAMLDDITARTSGVVAINFLTAEVDHDALATAASRVRIVDFFWSPPDGRLVEAVHAEGALACWQVGSVDEARAAVDAGCDVLAAQGTEAGGHVWGEIHLMPLLEGILAVVDVPVLAAGGIVDRATFRAALDAGAAGARVGTRFLATVESSAHPLYKQALVDAGTGSTEITDEFAVCPLCAAGTQRPRVLRASIDAVRRADSAIVGTAVLGGKPIDVPRGFGLPPDAAAAGDVAAMAMYAGEGVGAVDSIIPARR